MASRNSKLDLGRIGGFFAFGALIIAGVIFVITKLIELVGGTIDFGLLQKVVDWSLLISVVISGFIYLESTSFKNKTAWRIVFWIFVILAALGLII